MRRGMGYRAVVLPVFGTFVLSRRLESILGYIRKKDYDRGCAMLKEAYDNLVLAEHTDLVGRHKDVVCCSLYAAIHKLGSGDAGAEGYIEDIASYVDVLMERLADAYDALVAGELLGGLPDGVRHMIADAAF